MRDTFLFDLDGTLLPMDFDRFMEVYFHQLGTYFYGKIDPKVLAHNIMSATEYMVKNNNGLPNEDKFMNYFGSLVDGDIEDYKKGFLDFYDTLFDNVKVSTKVSEEILESIQILKDKGYKVAIATNPLFPMIANLHRIKWAGLDVNDFEYVSSFEENKYCKPHIEYYQEVLDKMNRKPESCYMVGNDVFDDLPAGKLGIKTYLITDCMLNKYNLENTANHTGSYQDFLQFVKELEPIN